MVLRQGVQDEPSRHALLCPSEQTLTGSVTLPIRGNEDLGQLAILEMSGREPNHCAVILSDDDRLDWSDLLDPSSAPILEGLRMA